MGIVVVGATFMDVKGYPLSQFYPGSGRNSGTVEQVHGGVCRNIAEDIANVELRPTLISLVDDNGMGDEILRKLERHKVNTKYMRQVPNGMGTWLAVFDNDGDCVASISKRPDLTGIVEILDQYGDEIFSKADAIDFEIDIEREIQKRLFAYAEKYQIPVHACISNMSIALERRDLMKKTSCLVCNLEESGLLFSEDFGKKSPKEMVEILDEKIRGAQIPRMVVTMGGKGAVYASLTGEKGIVPAIKTNVVDTTGCGDAFFSGVSIGLTYGKTLEEACVIGTKLASSVIITKDNVCPRYLPEEFGIGAPEEE